MRDLTRRAALAAACLLCADRAMAKDDLLETLAQKGVITMEEYQKLKASKAGEITLNTDDGFRIATPDNAYSIAVGTLQQLDFAWYDSDEADLADGSEFRRSRLSLTGVFARDFAYRVEYEFSGTTALTDAYVAYTGMKPYTVEVGQFKQPFGMEAITADKNGTFMERGLPFAFLTTRAPGLMVGAAGTHWSANLGGFGEPVGNAQTSTTNGTDETWAVAARGTCAPVLQGTTVLHLGAGFELRNPRNETSTNTKGQKVPAVTFSSKPESNELTQRLVSTGEIDGVDRFQIEGLELAGEMGAASIQGEYHLVQVERDAGKKLSFEGWYAQLAYTLTGEARPYKGDKGVFDGIRPRSNFSHEGGWGAFEIAGRVSGLDLTHGADDNKLGGKETNATAALSWYLNPVMRLSANVVKVLKVKDDPFDNDEPTIYEMRMQFAI